VRLAFAVAINVDPDILVVDEALSVGDEAFQRKCFARIEQIKDRGATILFVSHGAQTIVQLCDRAILMDGGEKLLDGPPKPVVSQYQRLVNANAPDQATIRAELKAIVFEFNETESLTAGTLQVEAKQEAVSARHLTLLPASFNPDLKSESVVEYEKNGACIFEMAIFDRHRNPVNLLVHTEEYEMTYKVRFDRNVEFVGFGMMIRTATGIDVMGQGSHWLGRGASAKAGQTIEVRFPFSCQLLPGTYFINAGVSEHYNISYELLHRILDGIMFKVLPCDFPRPIVGLFNAVGGRIAVDDVLIELVGGD